MVIKTRFSLQQNTTFNKLLSQQVRPFVFCAVLQLEFRTWTAFEIIRKIFVYNLQRVRCQNISYSLLSKSIMEIKENLLMKRMNFLFNFSIFMASKHFNGTLISFPFIYYLAGRLRTLKKNSTATKWYFLDVYKYLPAASSCILLFTQVEAATHAVRGSINFL